VATISGGLLAAAGYHEFVVDVAAHPGDGARDTSACGTLETPWPLRHVGDLAVGSTDAGSRGVKRRRRTEVDDEPRIFGRASRHHRGSGFHAEERLLFRVRNIWFGGSRIRRPLDVYGARCRARS